MNIKDLIKWSLKHWWWYAISMVLCGIAGGIYYLTTAPKFGVEAVLMLRQNESSNQDEMLRMMGFGGGKITGDEVKVLTSRDLMGRVVDSLKLCTTYSKKGKRFWQEQYPQHDLMVQLCESQLREVKVKVTVCDKAYKIKVKSGLRSQRMKVTSLDAPIHTFVGDIMMSLNDTVKQGTFSALIFPRMMAIENQLKSITISRLSRESNVITLSTPTKCPARSEATINTLLDLYNETTAVDKNQLAIQTEQFLADRIEVIAAELNWAESELEMYKRVHQIANLEASASTYQQAGEAYENQVIAIDDELRILDFVAEVLPNYLEKYALIPSNMGLTDGALCSVIQDYNNLITRRNGLLQTATEKNVVVELLTEQIDQRKMSIDLNLNQLRNTLLRRREFIKRQQDQYDSRLASIPETERRYLEMSREKQTKEKQYLYLIEKREENAMLLAADAVPAKIVDRAHQNPNCLAPKISTTAMGILFLGLFIPIFLYFFGIIRKELV